MGTQQCQLQEYAGKVIGDSTRIRNGIGMAELEQQYRKGKLGGKDTRSALQTEELSIRDHEEDDRKCQEYQAAKVPAAA